MPKEPDDEDLRTTVRDFKASVASEFAEVHQQFAEVHAEFALVHAELANNRDGLTNLQRQMVDLQDEVRTRTTTLETALVNSFRDLNREMDRRFTGIEIDVRGLNRQVAQLDDRVARLEQRPPAA